MISLGSRLIACCKLVPTLARQIWCHNYVTDRTEYLIFILSESSNPWVYSLQLFSTHHSWRYERKCEWVFFLNTVYIRIQTRLPQKQPQRLITFTLWRPARRPEIKERMKKASASNTVPSKSPIAVRYGIAELSGSDPRRHSKWTSQLAIYNSRITWTMTSNNYSKVYDTSESYSQKITRDMEHLSNCS